MAGGLATRELK